MKNIMIRHYTPRDFEILLRYYLKQQFDSAALDLKTLREELNKQLTLDKETWVLIFYGDQLIGFAFGNPLTISITTDLNISLLFPPLSRIEALPHHLWDDGGGLEH